MRVDVSAHRHNVLVVDMMWALAHPLRVADQEDPERKLVIGPARDGRLLEIVYLVAIDETDEDTIIHADELRPNWYQKLR